MSESYNAWHLFRITNHTMPGTCWHLLRPPPIHCRMWFRVGDLGTAERGDVLILWLVIQLPACDQNKDALSPGDTGARSACVEEEGPDTFFDGDEDGISEARGDCNDGDPGISPSAAETEGDGVDSNCDGVDREVSVLSEGRWCGPWASALSGTALASDDLDGDGYADLSIGAPAPYNEAAAGRAFVLFGPVLSDVSVDDTTPFMGELADSLSLTGYSIVNPGDMNGDGLGELVYAIPLSDGTEFSSGRVFLIDGPADESNNYELPERWIEGSVKDAYMGYGLAPAGDADGDGLADLLVGETRFGYRTVLEPGRAYLFLGPVGGATRLTTPMSRLLGRQSRIARERRSPQATSTEMVTRMSWSAHTGQAHVGRTRGRPGWSMGRGPASSPWMELMPHFWVRRPGTTVDIRWPPREMWTPMGTTTS